LALTTIDYAKYPFILGAAEEVKKLDLKIEDFTNPEFEPVLDRAESRVKEALESNPPTVEYRLHQDPIEISSFPVAVMLAAASTNDYIKRRYALAEAKRAYGLLKTEDTEKIMKIATIFNWHIRAGPKKIGDRIFDFALRFTDFLKNTGNFHETEWKLVNRVMLNGEVYLTPHDAARLLQEEIRRHIEKKLELDARPLLPSSILERVDRLTETYAGRLEEGRFEFSKEVVNEAFPPCIQQLYDAAKSGSHLSHVGRFTLTSFLLRIGMEPNDVVELFRTSSDFNERMTRYQIEHIAGKKGSRTEYKPPKCATLRTHGVCPGIDASCRKVGSPLYSYARTTRTLKKEAEASGSKGQE
jgi:DNA primase large subunit